jgi:CheY-like chemotaxis protein
MTATGIDVLIAEDNPTTRFGYQQLLSRWGFITRTAHNGLAALVQLRMAKPDILLSDLEMPGMNGFELLAIVRRLYPEIRTVAMSGAFAGDQVPDGVCADAFYAKAGGGFPRLHAILNGICHPAFEVVRTRPQGDLSAAALERSFRC